MLKVFWLHFFLKSVKSVKSVKGFLTTLFSKKSVMGKKSKRIKAEKPVKTKFSRHILHVKICGTQ